MRQCCFVEHGVVLLLGFGWRDVPDGLQQPSVVEPVEPFKCGEFDRFEVSPRPSAMNDLGLVKTIDLFRDRCRKNRRRCQRTVLFRLPPAALSILWRHIARRYPSGGRARHDGRAAGHGVPGPEHQGRNWHERSGSLANRRYGGVGTDHESDVNEALLSGDIRERERHSMFGFGARNWRLTRSSGHGAALSDTVVLMGLPRMMPSRPIVLMRRATGQHRNPPAATAARLSARHKPRSFH